MFPPNFMSTIYFVFGLCQTVAGYAAWVFRKQESFRVEPSDYPNIGSHPKRLVVFFSRMGYVKKVAYEEADRTGAAVYEIKARERTEGTAGFWWCGQFAMHRWATPIEPIGPIYPGMNTSRSVAPFGYFRWRPRLEAFAKRPPEASKKPTT